MTGVQFRVWIAPIQCVFVCARFFNTHPNNVDMCIRARHLNSIAHKPIVCVIHFSVCTDLCTVSRLPSHWTILSQLLSISVALVKCNCITLGLLNFVRWLLWIHYDYSYSLYSRWVFFSAAAAAFISLSLFNWWGLGIKCFVKVSICMVLTKCVHMTTLLFSGRPQKYSRQNTHVRTLETAISHRVVKCIICFDFASLFSLTLSLSRCVCMHFEAIKYPYTGLDCHVLAR